MSMITSDAWKDLTGLQQRLYVYCKIQAYAEQPKPDPDDPLCFTMSKGKRLAYGLYDKGNDAGFVRDMASLVGHGFVVCRTSGQATRTKTIYRFSHKWQYYGEPEFKILPDEMTDTMLNERKKSKAREDENGG